MQQQQEEEKYKEQFKIILLGNSCVGKTTLLQKFFGEPDNDSYCDNLGVDLKETFLNFAHCRIKLRIFDTSGSPKLDFLVKPYLSLADGAFICFDVTNPPSFEDVKNHVKKIKQAKNNIPIFLIGCKADLSHLRFVSAEQIKELAEQLKLPYFETSSRKEVNIKEPFLQIMQQMYFLALVNRIKPILEQYFDDYLKSRPKSNNFYGLFVSRSSKEDILRDEYKNIFEKLCQASKMKDLEDFFRGTLDILERSDLLFANENPVLSIATTSPLSKTLKKILSDLNIMTKDFVNLSELADLNKLQFQ